MCDNNRAEWCHCLGCSAWLKGTSPALGRMLLLQENKQYSNLCSPVEMGRKEKDVSRAELRPRGPEALPVQLLSYVKGVVAQSKHWIHVIFTWMVLRCDQICFRAKHQQKQRWQNIKKKKKNHELIKSQTHGPLGSEQQDCSRVFTHKRGTKQLRWNSA